MISFMVSLFFFLICYETLKDDCCKDHWSPPTCLADCERGALWKGIFRSKIVRVISKEDSNARVLTCIFPVVLKIGHCSVESAIEIQAGSGVRRVTCGPAEASVSADCLSRLSQRGATTRMSLPPSGIQHCDAANYLSRSSHRFLFFLCLRGSPMAPFRRSLFHAPISGSALLSRAFQLFISQLSGRKDARRPFPVRRAGRIRVWSPVRIVRRQDGRLARRRRPRPAQIYGPSFGAIGPYKV